MLDNLWINQHLKTLYDKMSEPILKKYQITKLEMDILSFLSNNPNYNTASDIAENKMLKKSNVSISVNDLVDRGFLRMYPSPYDRRIHYLALEDTTKEMVDEILQMQLIYKDSLTKGFSIDEIESIYALFDKMTHNIEDKLEEIKFKKKEDRKTR